MNKEVLANKQSLVAEISDAFKNSQSVTVVEYRGLTVAKLEELRKLLRAEESSFKIYKNTLVTKAAKDLGYEGFDEFLAGPNALIFSNKDEVSAPKILAKFAKKNDKMVFKGGIVSGKVLGADDMKKVAALPTKNGLISMFLSCLNAPITKFAATVKAVAEKEN